MELPSGNPLPPFATQTICYAHLSFEPGDTVDDRPEERKVAVAVGNTGTEALSAYLADFCARDPGLANKTPNPADLEDQLEAIHLASQFEGRIVDIGPKFREARHNKEFNGVMAGTLWTIRLEKTASGQANAHEAATYAEDTLPPELGAQLDWLNVCQQDFDRDCDEIESLRKQLFADWYKYMLCVYPPEGNRDQYPNHDEVKYFIEKNDLFLLQRRISKNNLLKFKRDQAFTNLYQAVVELQLLTPAHCGVDKSGGDQDGFSKTLKKPKLTETTATFTTPNIGSNVTVSVQNSQSIAQGSTILIQGAGAYLVISVLSTTSITVQNLGSTGNVPPNTQINAGADIRDTVPIPLRKLTQIAASFISPDIGNNITVSVQNSQSIARGSTILIQGAGAYSVISVPSTTSITVQNPPGSTGNVPPNTQINAGADIRARLIEIGELGKKIREALKVQELSAAEFALQMIEGAEKVRFCSKP